MIKKNIKITVFIIVFIAGIILVIVNNYDYFKLQNHFVNVTVKEELNDNYIILTKYNDYREITNETRIKESDFNNNDFILLKINYNPCSDDEIEPTGYTLHNGIINIDVKYKAICGVCTPQNLYYLVKIDKNTKIEDVKITYMKKNNPQCDEDIDYKPIIYLYPEKEINIDIKLGRSDLLLTTYPKYNNNWNVKALPNGDLIDLNTGRYQYGLYWEGINHFTKIEKDGFVIKGSETIPFLEEKLKLLGLNEREADEFIIYWLPKLEHNIFNYIRFETIQEINNYMPLEINPKPDTIIRILMDYKPLTEEINVIEQKLTTPERKGFTVIEWGGSIIK